MSSAKEESATDIDQAVKRVKELSDQAIEQSKESGLAWLQAYENVLESMLRLQKQAAASTQIDWINNLANTNADLMREVSQVYLAAAKNHLS